jgi:cytochrome c553
MPDMFPVLAGKEEAYIVEQLTAFRSGERQNPTMQPMAGALSDEDIANLAAYLSEQ